MMLLAQGLGVQIIEEQSAIATMGLDMVDDVHSSFDTDTLTHPAERLTRLAAVTNYSPFGGFVQRFVVTSLRLVRLVERH